MNKIYINIFVPTLDKNFNVEIPINMDMQQFIMEIQKTISELTEGLLLGLTLGMLIYISVFELSHQIYHMENKTLSRMCILFGLAILVFSVLIGHYIGG